MVWAVTLSLRSGDAAGPACLSCSVCLLTAWGCPAILLWPQQHGQYGWDNRGQFSFALNQNARSWEKARKEDFGVGSGRAARGWSPQSCSEPCWHSPVGAAESPHAPTLGDVSPPAHLLPQCYVCRCSNCWAPQPMLFLMLQEKSKYFSSPTRAAQRERLSWEEDCFLLAPLCLPYVYHSVCKNSLHPLRTQPPTEFCTFRTTSPHTASTLPDTSIATAANTAWLDRAPGRLQQYRLIQALHILFWRPVLAQKDLTPRQVRMYFLQELSTALALHLPALAAHLWRSILSCGIHSWKEKLQRKCVSPNRLTCSTLFYPRELQNNCWSSARLLKTFCKDYGSAGKRRERNQVFAFSRDYALHKPMHVTVLKLASLVTLQTSTDRGTDHFLFFTVRSSLVLGWIWVVLPPSPSPGDSFSWHFS